MNLLLVDDERLALNELCDAVEEALPNGKIFAFGKAKEALEEATRTHFDIAFLDINMCFVNGIEMAKQLIALNPRINIIFCTGYGEYMGEAFNMHASGYLTKPITAQGIANEVQNLRYKVENKNPLLTVKLGEATEAYDKDGNKIVFNRNKIAELLSVLVKNGKSVNSTDLCEALWEDNGVFLEKNKRYLWQLFSDLRTALKNAGAEEVLKKTSHGYYIDTDLVNII